MFSFFPKSISFALQFIVAFFLLPLSFALADEVFTWTDSEGRVHYSAGEGTDKSSQQKQRADLPLLGRENIQSKIERVKSETPPTCESHGGVDCAQGEDSDGSVICLDGFRKAKLWWRERCVEAELQAEFLFLRGSAAEPVPHQSNFERIAPDEDIRGIQLSLRNLGGAKALGLSVQLRIPYRFGGFRTETFTATGPSEVEPFGLADYTLMLSTIPPPALDRRQLAEAKYRVLCSNCKAIKSKK